MPAQVGRRRPFLIQRRAVPPIPLTALSYLREDFSMSLAVKDADPWPDTQRYDYLIRIRDVGKDELKTFGIDLNKTASETPKPTTPYPQQEAVRFALTRLTGQDYGLDVDKWKSHLGNVKAPPKKP